MIDFGEVKELIQNNSSKLRCHKIGLKPLDLALSVSILSNSGDSHGYIVIGAESINGVISICGLSATVNIATPIEKALGLFGDNKPELEFSNVEIKGRNVFVIKVLQYVEQLQIKLPDEPKEKEDKFIYDLFYACIKLQENYLYKTQNEDDRNAFIETVLEAKEYRAKDQTRRGLSVNGKASGEVDIYIEDERKMSFTIIEALNLDSLNKEYLNKHIDKIYNYDTAGNKFNVCLSYVNVGDFGGFWNKYLEHIKIYDYKHKLINVDESYGGIYQYSEIRIAKTTHLRSNMVTHLFHIAVNLA